MKINSKTT